jgi:hypothetical protein
MAIESFIRRASPAIPRKIPRETVDFETKVGQVFFNLVRSVTSRYPKIVVDGRKEGAPPIELTKSEKRMIGLLNRSTNPQELIEIMFKNPPSVFAIMDEDPQNTVIPLRPPGEIVVTKSPEVDTAIAEKLIKIPENLGEMQGQALNLIIKACQNYLKAPKIHDGFSEKDLNRRGLWVLGLSTVLRQLTADPSNKHLITRKARYDWETYFNELWNNNRYAGTRRDAVYMNLPLISMIQFPDNIHQELTGILDELEKTKAVFKDGQIDLATDTIATQCARVLSLFQT